MVSEQDLFMSDLTFLIQFARSRLNLQVTGGELFRSLEQEEQYIKEGKSSLKDPAHNLHTQRLAIDLNFFKDGQQLLTKEELQPVGAYWESLDTKNHWGGSWSSFLDLAHFERRP